MTIVANYTCSAGEMIDQISINIYGTDSYVQELLAANPKLSGRIIMQGGERLEVPRVTEYTEGITVNAPWREDLK